MHYFVRRDHKNFIEGSFQSVFLNSFVIESFFWINTKHYALCFVPIHCRYSFLGNSIFVFSKKTLTRFYLYIQISIFLKKNIVISGSIVQNYIPKSWKIQFFNCQKKTFYSSITPKILPNDLEIAKTISRDRIGFSDYRLTFLHGNILVPVCKEKTWIKHT